MVIFRRASCVRWFLVGRRRSRVSGCGAGVGAEEEIVCAGSSGLAVEEEDGFGVLTFWESGRVELVWVVGLGSEAGSKATVSVVLTRVAGTLAAACSSVASSACAVSSGSGDMHGSFNILAELGKLGILMAGRSFICKVWVRIS